MFQRNIVPFSARLVVVGPTNPWIWRCYIPSKLDMLNYLLHHLTFQVTRILSSVLSYAVKYSCKWCLKNFSWIAKEFMMKVIMVFILSPTLKNLGGTYLLSFFFFIPCFHLISIILTTAVVIYYFGPAVFTQVRGDSPSLSSIFRIYIWSMFKFVHDYKANFFQKIN